MQSFYYIFTCFLILLYSAKNINIESYLKVSIDIVFIFLYPIIVALFFGLRNVDIGLDSRMYLIIFNDPSKYDFQLEGGFLLLNRFLKCFSSNSNYYLFMISYILCFIQVVCFYYFDKNNYFYYITIFCCFFYFYQFHLNIVREGIAVSLVSLGFVFYKKNKKILFIILGLIAVSIHVTALIFFLYPIFSIKYNKKIQFFLLVILIILFNTSITSKIVLAIPNFHWSIEKLKTYFYLLLNPVVIKQTHLISFSIIIIFTIFYNKMKKSKLFYLYSFHTVFFVFLGLFHECTLVYDRFYFYIQFFEPILLYEFRILVKEKQMYNYLIILFVLLMSYVTIFLWGPRNFISPYSLQF